MILQIYMGSLQFMKLVIILQQKSIHPIDDENYLLTGDEERGR